MGNCLVLEEKESIRIEKVQSEHLYGLRRPGKMQAKDAGTVRIKLVISKHELKEILGKDGLTLEDMTPQIRRDRGYGHRGERARRATWEPALESISEVNDLQ